jgi:phosphodiesterase/alkaline phosphatase D-like protein
LYQEAWSEPAVRWLLSVVPTIMIFDDHDVHDDWNTSAAWRAGFEAKPWWRARITGAYQSYWVYQHLGNLSPAQLAADETWRQVRQAGDAAPVLADFALRADGRAAGIRFSDDGKRQMVDEAEWAWVTDSVTGDWDHVVLATSLPLLLPRGIHGLEAWNEAACDGARGQRFARVGERVRQALDLEHWAAFGSSFENFERLLSMLAGGAYGTPPASVTVISGDVHNSYLAPASLPAAAGFRTAVWQAVCSPVHNVLPPRFRRGCRLAESAAGGLAGSVLARLAGVRKPGMRWRVTQGPWFDNMLAALEFDGRGARIRFDRAVGDGQGAARLEPVYETELSRDPA